MRLNLAAAVLLSLLFIVEIAAVSGMIAGANGFVQMPMVDPKVTAILVAGAGSMLAFFILYKSYS
jgi:hypothetical protein